MRKYERMFGFFEPIHLKTQRRKDRERQRHLRKTAVVFKTEHSLVFPKLRGSEALRTEDEQP